MFENRRWLVIPTSITGSIDFTQVLEKSVDSLRLSTDGSKTFVKYEINEVTSSYDVTVPSLEEGGGGYDLHHRVGNIWETIDLF